MNWEEKIIDYLNDELSPELTKELELKVEQDQNIKKLLEDYKIVHNSIMEDELEEPNSNMHDRFNKMLEDEIAKGSRPHFSYLMIAASVLFLICFGVLIGLNLQKDNIINDQKNNIALLKNDVKSLILDNSVSTRINAINVSYDIDNVDPEIENILLKTMLEDQSPNVRLAAVDALVKYSKSKQVRDGFLYALLNEKDAYVKIAIIHKLIDFKENKALPTFDQLIEDADTPMFVKNEIYLAKQRMSLI